VTDADSGDPDGPIADAGVPAASPRLPSTYDEVADSGDPEGTALAAAASSGETRSSTTPGPAA